MEAVRQASKQPVVSEALVAAVEEAEKSSHQAKIKHQALQREEKRVAQLEKQSSRIGKVETRGRPRKGSKKFDVALGDAEEESLVASAAETRRQSLLKQVRQFTHFGKRPPLTI